MKKHQHLMKRGFTLIELSIVLVIIGLIVGGVLVGRDLISAASVRAQVSQIEKYQTAANTFRGKYNNYLPGDIPPADAARFGLAARGTGRAQGDGDGLIECPWGGDPNTIRICVGTGEAALFWRDLSAANLVNGSFNYATCCSGCTGPLGCTPFVFSAFLPKAAIGQDNYVVMYAAGYYNTGTWTSEGANYLSIQYLTSAGVDSSGSLPRESLMPLTVTQAYNIDKKVDDGLPQTGTVTARFATDIEVLGASGYAIAPGGSGILDTAATAGFPGTCYDNSNTPSGTPGILGATQHYSLEMNNGTGMNCALSFKLQ